MKARDPKERFTDRVTNYAKYRPTYPFAAIELLQRECGLPHKADRGMADGAQTSSPNGQLVEPASQYLSSLPPSPPGSPSALRYGCDPAGRGGFVVADIGSGTGILTSLLLDTGATVFAVEPNAAMRGAAEEGLAANPCFRSVNATAENTTLASGSIDLITAGQAFHWFDWDAAQAEFRRILKPNGHVALIWNDRSTASPFMRGYEELLQRYSVEYAQVCHRNMDEERLARFFRDSNMSVGSMPNVIRMGREALVGRVLSSSYVPQEGEAGHENLMSGLHDLFNRHESSGEIEFIYDTQVFYGRL